MVVLKLDMKEEISGTPIKLKNLKKHFVINYNNPVKERISGYYRIVVPTSIVVGSPPSYNLLSI
tara:strand:+ start:49 stop:240 length:192 start_codon:yes stop_codon:yes gene_type:complete